MPVTLEASAEIGYKSRKGQILKLYESKAAHPPKKPRWGYIVYTAMAKTLKKVIKSVKMMCIVV